MWLSMFPFTNAHTYCSSFQPQINPFSAHVCVFPLPMCVCFLLHLHTHVLHHFSHQSTHFLPMPSCPWCAFLFAHVPCCPCMCMHVVFACAHTCSSPFQPKINTFAHTYADFQPSNLQKRPSSCLHACTIQSWLKNAPKCTKMHFLANFVIRAYKHIKIA